MKAKIFYVSIYIVLITVVQSTVLDYIRIYDTKPNLLVVFVICFSLLRGNMTEGAVVGLFAGLAQDIVTGKVIGLYSLLGMFLGLILSSVNKRLYRDNVIVVVFFTFAATAAYELILMFYVYIKQAFNLVEGLRYRILPISVYNSVFAILFYIITSRLNRKLESHSKSTRKY